MDHEVYKDQSGHQQTYTSIPKKDQRVSTGPGNKS